MCHARTADRYFLTTAIEIGSKGIPIVKFGSSTSGSVAAHNANEWRMGKDTGRRSDSGMVKMSQNR